MFMTFHTALTYFCKTWYTLSACILRDQSLKWMVWTSVSQPFVQGATAKIIFHIEWNYISRNPKGCSVEPWGFSHCSGIRKTSSLRPSQFITGERAHGGWVSLRSSLNSLEEKTFIFPWRKLNRGLSVKNKLQWAVVVLSRVNSWSHLGYNRGPI